MHSFQGYKSTHVMNLRLHGIPLLNKVCNVKLIRLYFDFFRRDLVTEIACANTVSCKLFLLQIAIINFQKKKICAL